MHYTSSCCRVCILYTPPQCFSYLHSLYTTSVFLISSYLHSSYTTPVFLISSYLHSLYTTPVFLISSYSQGCGNIEPTTGHFDLFSPPLSCYIQFSFSLPDTRFIYFHHPCPVIYSSVSVYRTLDLLDNVLHDLLFPHYCI